MFLSSVFTLLRDVLFDRPNISNRTKSQQDIWSLTEFKLQLAIFCKKSEVVAECSYRADQQVLHSKEQRGYENQGVNSAGPDSQTRTAALGD